MNTTRASPILRGRERAMMIPLLILMVWMGVYSNSFLRPMDASVAKLMNQSQSGRVEYAESVGKALLKDRSDESRHDQHRSDPPGSGALDFRHRSHGGGAVCLANPRKPGSPGLRWPARSPRCSALVPMAANRGQWYSNLWIVDDFDIFLSFVFLLIAAITILTSADYLRREKMNHPEFYALLLFATAGMLMMAASNELVMVFLGLEILSIATYVMAGFRRTDLKSNESALKYFLLGSFSSAFFLYGVALIFGATGSTNLITIAEVASLIRSSDQPGRTFGGADADRSVLQSRRGAISRLDSRRV